MAIFYEKDPSLRIIDPMACYALITKIALPTAEAEKAEINDRLSSEVSELRTQLDVMTQQIEN